MESIGRKNVLFHLAWISNPCDRVESACVYDVVLKVKEVDRPEIFHYISFTFGSIDEMFLYLKTLAKYYNAYSIDSLQKMELPAKMEYYECFNRPDVMKALLLPNGVTWPTQHTPVSFLTD